MSQKFKIVLLFTLTLFFVLIILTISTKYDLQKSSWYSLAIMYFFSFSIFQIGVLDKSFSKGRAFVQSHLFLTALKMFLSVMFIVAYGMIMGDEIESFFFIWFLSLYLLYTALLGWLFYKKK